MSLLKKAKRLQKKASETPHSIVCDEYEKQFPGCGDGPCDKCDMHQELYTLKHRLGLKPWRDLD